MIKLFLYWKPKKIYYSYFIKVLNKIENLFVFFVSPKSPTPSTLQILVVRSLMWFSAFLTRIIVFSTCCGGSRASGSFEGLTVGTGGSEMCISPSWYWDCCSGGAAMSPRGSLDRWAFSFDAAAASNSGSLATLCSESSFELYLKEK